LEDRVLSSKTIFEGKVLTLRVDDVEAADGHRSQRDVIEHRGAVGIVCVHDGQIVLVRQYRHATREVLLEIPAGKLEGEEDPEATAARELTEEVGLFPHSLEHLATFYTTPGFTNEKFYLYLCMDAEDRAGQTEQGEVIEVERRPLASVRELIDSGDIRDAKTLLGLSFLALRTSST